MKKATLIMLTAASMLFATPGMMNQNKVDCKKCTKALKGKYCKKELKRKMYDRRDMKSLFLIQRGLPHLGKMIMPYYNDPSFNLTDEQKTKLDQVRKSSMGIIAELQPKIIQLREEIITESSKGVSTDTLKDKVAQLSLLQSTATLTQLRCIEETKAILTKDQLLYMLVDKKGKYQNKPRKKM